MLSIDNTLKELYKKDNIPKYYTLYFPSLNLTIMNDQLAPDHGDFVLTERLCSDTDLIFGKCEASQVKFTLADVIDDLTDLEFTITQTVGTYILPFGTYKVDSCKKQNDKRFKDIIAYDRMSKIESDVTAWYNGLFPTGSEAYTLAAFRSSFLTYIGLQEDTTNLPLPNDTMLVRKTIDTTQLSGRVVLEACEELNGVFGHISRSGKFKHVILDPTSVNETITKDICRKPVKFEEYTVKGIDKLQIRQEEGDVGAIVGTGTNAYVIEGNFLVFGKSASELEIIANNVLINFKDRIYSPCQSENIGLAYVEVGDNIAFESDNAITSYVLQRTLTGIQALKDEFVSEGSEKRTQNFDLNKEIIQLKGKSAILKRTVEEMSSTITDLNGDVSALSGSVSDNTSDIAGNAQKILNEAQRAQQVESNLSASITQTANTIRSEVSASYATKEALNTTNGNVTTAQNTANTASTNANNALTQLTDIMADNKITPDEKQALLKEWNSIVSEKTLNDAQADVFDITTEKSSYGTKYTSLNTYVNTTYPLFSSLTTTTMIDSGNTFRTKFKEYYDARISLLNAITTKAKSLSDAAQTTANTAVTNAATAQTTANTASTNASNALSQITDVMADNKITPDEKQMLLKEWNVILSEKTLNDTQATTFGITTEKTAYGTAYTALNTYINTTYPLFSSLTTTTTIDSGATLRTKFKNYYDARTNLLNAIATKAKTLADTEASRAIAAEANLSASITQTADTIRSEVSATYTTKNEIIGLLPSETLYPSDTLYPKDSVISDLRSDYNSKIEQTAISIAQEVNRASETEGTLSGRIDVTAEQIELRVTKAGVIAAINLTSEAATIKASKINFNGFATFDVNGNLTTIDGSVLKTGTVVADTVKSTWVYTGTLNANQITAGTINGVKITTTNGTYTTTIWDGYIVSTYIEADHIRPYSMYATHNINVGDNIYLRASDGDITCSSINSGIPITSANLQSRMTSLNVTAPKATSATSASSASSASIANSSRGISYSGDPFYWNGVYFSAADNFRPTLDADASNGSSEGRWSVVYAQSSTIVTSDRRKKDKISDLSDKYISFGKRLLELPRTFQMIDGQSGRIHIGFVAQDVEAIMDECSITDMEFAGLIKSPIYSKKLVDTEGHEINEYDTDSEIIDYNYGLRYEEFIALLFSICSELYNRVELLENC